MLMTQSKREPRAWTTNCTTKTRPGSERILQEHRGPVLYSRMISVFPVRDAYVSIAELIAEVTSYLVTDGEKKKARSVGGKSLACLVSTRACTHIWIHKFCAAAAATRSSRSANNAGSHAQFPPSCALR